MMSASLNRGSSARRLALVLTACFACLARAQSEPTAIANSTPAVKTSRRFTLYDLSPLAAPFGVSALCGAPPPAGRVFLEVQAANPSGKSSAVRRSELVRIRDNEATYSYAGALVELEPATAYRARCGTEGAWSDWQDFTTWDAVEAYPPSARPDRIILTWDADPATTQAVTWRTSRSVTRAIAEIAPSEAQPSFVMNAKRVRAVTTDVRTLEYGPVAYHSVRFENLTPDTVYTYRVGEQGSQWSEWFQFRTAARETKPFSFLYLGDAQSDIRSDFSRILRQAVLTAPDARFIIHGGDLVQYGDSDWHWGEWHAAAGWINGTIPVLPVVGNHEYGSLDGRRGMVKKLAPQWRAGFALPTNGPPDLEEQSYYVDFQGVRFIALNSTEASSQQNPATAAASATTQAKWLEAVLRDNPNRWTIVAMHHPLVSLQRPEGSAEMRAAWQPLLDRYGVDLVLEAHEHIYARFRIEGSGQVDPQKTDRGPVYVQSTGNGPPLTFVRGDPARAARIGDNIRLYQVIRIDGDTLRVEVYLPDGTLYDAFRLQKGAPSRDVLTDMPPSTPQMRSVRVLPAATTDVVSLSPAQLDALTGIFLPGDSNRWQLLKITRQGSNLVVTRPQRGGSPVVLSPVSPDEFVGTASDGRPVRMRFALDNGKAVRAELRRAELAPDYFERQGKETNK